MDELQKLYDVLKRDGYYTKSFDEFVAKWEDDTYKDKVYQVVVRDGLYTKDKESFLTKYSSAPQQPTQQPEQQPVVQPTVKKKDDMDSDWLFGDGSSESEPSKTESEAGLFGRLAQKAFSTKQPQQEQVEPIKRPETVEEASGTWGNRAKKEQPFSEPFSDYMQVYGPKKGEGVLAPTKPLDFVGRMTPELVKERTPKFLEDGLNALTPKQLASYGAKGAKETFDYYFKDAGFKFETDREYVRAISPDGKVYTYNTILPSRESLDEFKNFVRESAFNNPEIADKAYLYEKENKKFKTKEDISNEVKTINAQEEEFNGDYKKFLNLQRDINEIEADLKRFRDFGEQNTPKYIQTEAYLNERKKELQDYAGTIKEKAVGLEAQQTQLDKAVGKYTEFQATQGDFGGNVYRTITNTISGNFSQFLRLAVGKTIDVTPMSYLLGEENYQSQRDIRLKEKGYKDEKVVPISVLNEIDDEIREEFKKTAISGKIGDKKLDNILSVQGVRQAISETLNAPITTTDEYLRERQEKGSWIERGLLGLSGSLPAMVGGPAMRYINMYLMNTDAAMQEMDNNPNFANISENEKQLVALPIGVVSAALEEIGLKNLKLGKSITSGIIKTVIGRVPAGASASAIRNTTFDVVAEMGIKGTSAYVGGLLSEAETGILQQASEYAIKDIYESKWFRNRDMFDNPAFLSGQYIYDLYDSGRTELVGAGVMSVPYSIAAAYQKDGFRALDDATFKIFEDLAKDNDSRKFFVTSLKNKINLGEVTPTQGKQMLEAYDQASGMIGMVPDEITDPESRKVAMDLMSERIRLEKQKYGKDEALAKPIQNKINQINEQLTQLTEDAIQKQAASEVSLQPEAGAGQEVEVGGPEAKPKITPEESKRKEALLAALEAYADSEEDSNIRVYEAGVLEELPKKDVQAELDALNQKEQALVTEQVGMEQAEGLGAQLETVAKEEATPAEVTPAPQTTTDIITSAPIDIKGGVVVTDSNGNDVMVNGNEQVAAKLYDEAMATPEDQRTPEQNDIVEKVQRIISQVAAEVTPAEVTPAETTTTEVTPVEQQFTEQDRVRKAELEEAMRKADKRRKNITVGEVSMPKAEAKAELDALNQKEQATQQPVTPAVEAAPTATAPVETMTAEQEADLLEELMTGKKKEPVVTETAPTETAPTAEPTSKEAIAKRLRGKKNKGLMSSIDFGISQALYNGALEFMASQVEKDTKLGNAIANTIKWIDEKMQGKKWNKGSFGKYMNDIYKVTLGDGRQVDVLRDDSKETAEVINGWYQPIEQRIIDSKQDKQPANKWAEQLRSKEDEDLWTGVREFLESKGNQSVSKKELLDFMKNNRVEIVEVVKVADSQYSKYQLPGDKSNYKEVLVTMPPPQSKTPLTFKEENGLWNVYRDGKKILEGIDSLEEAKDLVDFGTDSDVTSSGQDVSKVFKSTHFDEPNILVHLRMNTRTDADGNKVLFLEEVQSDWGQQGKKQGFATTPSAPFVTDTNSWVKLGLKMALREAAAQGADKIAWTTGEQQNARYDLSKQVNKIDVEAVEEVDGLYFVDINLTTGQSVNLEVENGVVRNAESPSSTGGVVQQDYIGKRLEDIVGKDVAEKILSVKQGEQETLKGEGLKVGGKGMKGFYDGIVPGVAKALIKEVTGQEGKITEVNIEGNTQQAIDVTPEMKTQAKTALPLFSGSLADAVRKNLTIKTGGLQSNILGVPIAIWNAGVLTAAKAIDASVAASKAIQQGVNDVKNWIKKNNPSLSLSDAKIKNKILIDLYEGTIKTARENNVKTEGLITYFKRKGLSDAQIDVLLKDEKKKAEKPELSEETLPGYTKLMNRINDIIARGRRNGKTDDDIMKGVIANVESRSPEYANATDQQREQIIRDIRKLFGKKEKAAPSAAKITGKPKPKKVTVDEMTALKDQLRLEAKAAREAKGDINTKRKMLADAINKMVKKGSITVRQAKILIDRVNSVNLDNPVMVERLLDYAEKVFNDADYADKLSQANKLQSQIKQLSKNKDKFGNLTAFAAEFAKIDPAMVENIDEYIEMASKVKEGVQGSKTVNGRVIPADMVDVGATIEYVNETMKAQEEAIRLKTAERLQELMGVDVSDLTYDQMMELLEQPEGKDISDEKERVVRGFINRMFNTYSTIIKDMFDTGIDPFSDPENPTTVDFKDSEKKIVEEFMGMDLKFLDTKEALRAADALNNFLTNKSTAGMVAVLGEYNGRKNAREVNDKKVRAKPIKMYWSGILGKSYFQQIASIPLFFERLFKSKSIGNYVREKMGLNSLINHKSEAVTAANRVINNYILEFSKKKPNNKKFQDLYNIIERGIIGDLAKTIVGDAKQVEAEFNRRKKLIEESIQILEKGGTKKEKEQAKIMKEVYDNIAKDAKTIEDVKSKADKTNVDAVQFWVDTWAKLYDQFADVALNVYNRVLDKNVNYVPDRFGFLERAEKVSKDADGFESMFFANSNVENFYKKESGSLMKSTPPQTLFNKKGQSDMYVNLSFDTNNANALMEALIDIKTAADIRQIQAFKNSPEFDDIIPNGNDASLTKERIATLIRNIRNKRIITDKSFKNLVRFFDRLSSLGTALALAGPTQAISQTLPVAVNTFINSGGKLSLSNINNKDVNNFINNSGTAIANRGVEAATELESLNQKLEAAATTKVEVAARAIESINRKYLKIYLSNFDVFIARASWITYYEKGLRKQGIKGKVDYSTHELNKEAAQYAQNMLDRQQNISDKDLAGQLYQSDNPWKQFIVKVVMPLTTFRMNQTTRLSNDVAILISKTSSTEEKKEAAVSLGGFAAEMATFRLAKLYIGYYVFYSLAQFIRGEEDDEEDKEKKWNNMVKGAGTSVVSDVFSPIPQTDMPTKYLFSAVMDQLQGIAGLEEEDRFNIFTETQNSFASDYGLLGIAPDKMLKLYNNVQLAITGKFKDDFGNEKTLAESDRALLSDPFYMGLSIATAFGINPFSPETDNVMNNITKMAKKNAMSNEQLKEAEELGVEGKKDLIKVKADKKADKEEAYGGYKTLKEFEEKEPEKFDEYSAPGGKLDKYREQERKEDEEKNKDQPFRGLSEKKFKELYPVEWAKKYGPGTAYFQKQNTPAMLQKKAQEKMREAQREQKRKMAEAKRRQQEILKKASGK